MKRKSVKILVTSLIVGVLIGAMSIPAFASATTPVSLIDAEALTPVKDFAADAKPTLLAMWAIIIPASLTIWGMGTGLKKGIGKLKGMTRRAI